MSFDYAAARETAESLIAEFGASAVLRKPGTITGPAYAPTRGPAVDHAIKAVDLDLRQMDRAGSLIGEATRVIYVSTKGLAVEPAKADSILINGDVVEIEEILPLAPAGVVVFWEVRARW